MPLQRHYTVLFTTTIAITLLIVSCSGSKVSQCEKITNVTNKAASEAKAFTDGGKAKNPDAMLKVADTMDRAAKEMAAINVSDSKLKDYQTGLIKMYRDTSKSTREFVAAFQKKERTAVKSTLNQLKQAIAPEPILLNGLKTYCQG
ncbi:MAG TPA: hypothetical protein V6D15_06910 [Oculatellaceae cyanobacterium]